MKRERRAPAIDVAIRAGVERDYGFIVAAIRREVVEQEILASVALERARNTLTATIDTLVRGGVSRVACDRYEQTTLLGFALFDRAEQTLLFLYVAPSFRGRGIARRLVAGPRDA